LNPPVLKRKRPPVKGSYVLLMELSREQTVIAGKLGAINFTPGYYAYTGSAMNSLYPRIKRHLRRDKKMRWHIDYLLQKARIKDIIICETGDKIECLIAGALKERYDSVPGFGSSDCNCPSHVFSATTEMGPEVMKMLDSLGMVAVLKTPQSIRRR